MIVVDASAAVAALTGAREADPVRDRLADEDLHAPHLLDHEVLAALRALVLRGALGASRADDALTDLGDLRLTRWASSDPLRRRAWALRDNLSAYDAAYVALAEGLGCRLVTRDARLARAPGHDAVIEVS